MIAGADTRPATNEELQLLTETSTIKVEGDVSEVSFRFKAPDIRTLGTRHTASFLLVGPTSGTVAAEVVGGRWRILTDDKFLLGPYDLNETTTMGSLPDSMRRMQPTFIDEFRSAGLYRGELVYVANITSTLPGGGFRQSLAVLEEATIRIRFDRTGPAPDAVDAERDPMLGRLLKHVVLNPEMIPRAVAPVRPGPREAEFAAWNAMLAAAEKRGPVLFARLPQGGVYRIERGALVEAGVDPETFDLTRARFFSGKTEIPAYVRAAGKRLPAASDPVLFYVPEDPTDRKPFFPLWILQGAADEAPLRLALSSVAGSSIGTVAPAPVKSTISVFQPKIFARDLPAGGPELKWATAVVRPTSYSDFEFQAPGAIRDSEATVRVWSSGMENARSVTYEVLLNETVVGTASADPYRVTDRELKFSSDLLRAGTNKLTLHSPEPGPEAAPLPFTFIKAVITMESESTGQEPNTALQVMVPEPVSTLAVPVLRPGGSVGDLIAFDLKNPFLPSLVRGMPARQVNGEEITTFSFGEAAGSYTFAYCSAAAAIPVRGLKAVTAPRSFSATDEVTWLAVYPEGWRAKLEPLLDHRRPDYAVDAVSLDDVLGAFAYGEMDYKAIREFLRHTYATRKGRRLERVLMIGEASESWWSLRRATPEMSENLMPVWGWQDELVRIRGDEGYARIIGSGPLLDLEIGRFSVNNPGELTVMIDKLLAFENAPPVGDWMARNVFVLDDEPEFESVLDHILTRTLAGASTAEVLSLQRFPFQNYFRGRWRKRSAEMTDAVLNAFTNGARTVTYLGHGGPNLWSSERILHTRDVESIQDGGRHPLLIAGSCDTGWLDYPIEPVRSSLSELLTRRAGGGAIAAFIPVDGTSSYEHDYLLSGLFRGLYKENILGVGELSVFSKLEYARFRNNSAVTEQFILMGDPALRLPSMGDGISASAEPKQLMTVTGGQLKFSGALAETATEPMVGTTLAINLLNAGGETLAKTTTPVVEGKFDGTLVIPGRLPVGDYRAVLVASNSLKPFAAGTTLPITVEDYSLSVIWSTSPPVVNVIPAGTLVEITCTVVNRSPKALEAVTLSIREAGTGDLMNEETIAIPAEGEFKKTFSAAMPQGLFLVDAVLKIPKGEAESLDREVGRSRTVIRAVGERAQYVALPLQEIQLERLPLQKKFRVRVPVYNMTSEDMPLLGVKMSMKQATGLTPLGDMRIMPPLGRNGSTSIEVDSALVLPTGEQEFLLEFFDMSPSVPRLVQSSAVLVGTKVGPDLEIIPGSIRLETPNPVAGTTVYLLYDVRNSGTEKIENVRGRAYLTEPWIDQNLTPLAIAWAPMPEIALMEPGETKTFRVRWDDVATAKTEQDVFVTAAGVNPNDEADITNNVAKLTVAFLPPPNITVVPESLTASKKEIRPLERVMASATIRNDSPEDFPRRFRNIVSAVSVTGTRRRLLALPLEGLRAGESQTIQFEWQVAAGESSLEINANEDREYAEELYTDNLGTLQFEYQLEPADFAGAPTEWNLLSRPDFLMASSLVRLPGNAWTIANQPSEVVFKRNFDLEDMVSDSGAPRTEIGPRWIFNRRGSLVMNDESRPEPIRLRIRIGNDLPTTVQDVRLTFYGGIQKDLPVGGLFRYRLEGAQEWSKNTKREGTILLDRIDTGDNYLDVEFGSAEVNSYTALGELQWSAVMGTLRTSAIRLPASFDGEIDAEADIPAGCRLTVEYRFGAPQGEDLVWGDWQLHEYTDSIALGRAPIGSLLDVRVRLYGSTTELPTLRRMRILPFGRGAHEKWAARQDADKQAALKTTPSIMQGNVRREKDRSR